MIPGFNTLKNNSFKISVIHLKNILRIPYTKLYTVTFCKCFN